MSEVKINTDLDNVESDEVSYTLRGIPRRQVHEKIIAFQKEIAYKRNRKFNIEQAYTEALIIWAETRPEPQKVIPQ